MLFQDFEEIEKIYISNKLPSKLNQYLNKKQINNISKLMVNDKKNDDDKINLILLKRIGKTTIPGKIKMSVDKVNKFLKKLINFSSKCMNFLNSFFNICLTFL